MILGMVVALVFRINASIRPAPVPAENPARPKSQDRKRAVATARRRPLPNR